MIQDHSFLIDHLYIFTNLSMKELYVCDQLIFKAESIQRSQYKSILIIMYKDASDLKLDFIFNQWFKNCVKSTRFTQCLLN